MNETKQKKKEIKRERKEKHVFPFVLAELKTVQ